MEKLCNQGNPFALTENEADTLAGTVCAVLATAPALASPQYQAQLAAARQDGERFLALLRMPVTTRPH
jgi:hypothetical protein